MQRLSFPAQGFLAATNPAQLARLEQLLTLLSVAIIAVFLGWVIARWMRLRYLRVTAPGGPTTTRTDAWSESARRMSPTNDDLDDDGDGTVDLDPPPDQRPPRGPSPRWQS